MAEVLCGLVALCLVGVLSWNLGVRRERGRQVRLNAIEQRMRDAVNSKKGTRLKTIRFRR